MPYCSSDIFDLERAPEMVRPIQRIVAVKPEEALSMCWDYQTYRTGLHLHYGSITHVISVDEEVDRLVDPRALSALWVRCPYRARNGGVISWICVGNASGKMRSYYLITGPWYRRYGVHLLNEFPTGTHIYMVSATEQPQVKFGDLLKFGAT